MVQITASRRAIYCLVGVLCPLAKDLVWAILISKLTLLVPVTRPGMCRNLDAQHRDA